MFISCLIIALNVPYVVKSYGFKIEINQEKITILKKGKNTMIIEAEARIWQMLVFI